MPRNHSQYDGQVSAPFTVLTEFHKDAAGGYRFVFDTWISAADFDADGGEVAALRIPIAAAGAFATANAALLTQLGTLLLAKAGLGGRGFTLAEFQWFPVNKVMTMTATKAGESSIFTVRNAEHDAFYTANASVFDALNAAVWEHSKTKNVFLNAMTPAV